MRIVSLPILLALASGAAAASEHDFDFLNGTWDVHHHYLHIVGGRREWLDYDGDCVHRNLTGDWANIDEYVLAKPAGTYRAMALRANDPATDEWSIWWLDQRYPGGPLDPPMKGHFPEKNDSRACQHVMYRRLICAQLHREDLRA